MRRPDSRQVADASARSSAQISVIFRHRDLVKDFSPNNRPRNGPALLLSGFRVRPSGRLATRFGREARTTPRSLSLGRRSRTRRARASLTFGSRLRLPTAGTFVGTLRAVPLPFVAVMCAIGRPLGTVPVGRKLL